MLKWVRVWRCAYWVALVCMGLPMLSSSAIGQTSKATASRNAKMQAPVDAQGNLHVPSGYREKYEFLGTWAIATDKGSGSKEIHTVYAIPGTIAAYRKTGQFPDGTVLVKEVYKTATTSMTTGTVSHAESLQGWFVMMRDAKNSHTGNPLWGDGWGWSWFDAANL